MGMDYRVKIFRDSIKNNNEALIIYGTGVVASLIVPEIDDYNIEGIMDRDIKKGEYCGYPVLSSFREIKNSKRIILLAATSNLSIIYERIATECENKGIQIYDIWGRNLGDVFSTEDIDSPYFQIDKHIMKKKMLEYDVISFDLFDTLIMRMVPEPGDVFLLMEYISKEECNGTVFEKEKRSNAQKECEKRIHNPTIYEIYDAYQEIYNVSKKEKEYLLELEIETEKNIICAKEEMKELFNSFTDLKDVVVTSNMYIPSDILQKILLELGFSDKFQMFVSCEKKTSKEEELFKFVKKQFEGKRILHIGDSQVTDEFFPRQFGVDSFYTMKSSELLVNSKWISLYNKAQKPIEKMLLGRLLTSKLNSPFSMYKSGGRLHITDLNEFCDVFLVPLVVIYSIFVIREANINGCDYILYGARDGYIFEKVINILKEKTGYTIPSGQYFYASRRATSLLKVKEKKDAIELVSHYYKGNINEAFFVRLGVRIDESDKNIDIEKIVDKYWTEIENNINEQKKQYRNYIESIPFSRDKRMAYVEQSGAGTIINSLNDAYNLSLFGIFIHKTPLEHESFDFSSLFPYEKEMLSENAWGKANFILEFFLSSPEPTFYAFTEEMNPLFELEERSTELKKMFERMQMYVQKRSVDFLLRYPFFISEGVGWEYLATLFDLLDSNCSSINIPEFEDLKVDDCFGGESVVPARIVWNNSNNV